MTDVAVHFDRVSKRFCVGETHDSLRDLFASALSRVMRNKARRDPETEFWALRDVSFEVGRGEALGIIGPNGAGKSTVLRLLAGILRPNQGSIRMEGRLAALIEVGAGFHGDLTGRENVFLNGAILGMTRREIKSKLDAIVAFAGIERFLDMPVKRYSSGMYARLGFSIAAHVDPEILLVDEVLSVGDALFRVRCLERMTQLVQRGTSLVFVTHQLEQMRSICSRSIVLEGGSVTFSGSARDAVGHYLRAMSGSYDHHAGDLVVDESREGGAVTVSRLRFLDEQGDEVIWTKPRSPIRAELSFKVHRPIPQLILELSMGASFNEGLLCINSGRDGLSYPGTVGDHTVTLALPEIPLGGGQYFWNVRMWDAKSGTVELDTPFRFPLAIDDDGVQTGTVCVEHQWSFADDEPNAPRASVTNPLAGLEDVSAAPACVNQGVEVEDLPVR